MREVDGHGDVEARERRDDHSGVTRPREHPRDTPRAARPVDRQGRNHGRQPASRSTTAARTLATFPDPRPQSPRTPARPSAAARTIARPRRGRQAGRRSGLQGPRPGAAGRSPRPPSGRLVRNRAVTNRAAASQGGTGRSRPDRHELGCYRRCSVVFSHACVEIKLNSSSLTQGVARGQLQRQVTSPSTTIPIGWPRPLAQLPGSVSVELPSMRGSEKCGALRSFQNSSSDWANRRRVTGRCASLCSPLIPSRIVMLGGSLGAFDRTLNLWHRDRRQLLRGALHVRGALQVLGRPLRLPLGAPTAHRKRRSAAARRPLVVVGTGAAKEFAP